jgi:hypothetical protein
VSESSLFHFRGRVFLLAACGLVSAWMLSAQTFYGSIVGTVTDASRAAIPGAAVTLINTGTSDHRAATTDSFGNYEFVNLVPGVYRIEVQKSGFKRLTRDEIHVEVQSTLRIDAPLQVGDVGQVVEVSAESPLLQTETSSLGHVVEARAVQEMPLNGRNVINLVALVPGVVPQGQSMGNPTNTNISAWGNYQIGGGIGNQSAAFLDGAPINTSYNNAVMLVPTQDAIQEFRVQTNNLGAEFGRFAGGVINMYSKSGTNSFHGSAYEFLRNKVLNANTFFNNRSGIGVPAFTQNQFGANVGGPAIKDKTFFFFSYEGYRLRQGQSTLNSVPSAAMRAGDFSNVRTAQGVLVPIYDPLTTCGVLGNAACSGAATTRQPFANNIIPASRFDPAAKALESLWANPNLPGQAFTLINNFAANASTGGNNDQYNFRVDHTVSDKQRIFGRFTRWTDLNLPVDPFQTKTGIATSFTTQQAVFGDTYTITPTTIADLRLAFFRFTFLSTPQSFGVDLTTYAWPAYLNSQVAYREDPMPCVQGFSELCTAVTSIDANTNYSLSPSVTKIHGRHTLKIGGEVRRMQFNFGKSNQPSGVFNFDNLFTSVNPFAPAGTGYGFASYVLGYGATGSVLPSGSGNGNGIITPALTASQLYYQGYYVADIFQVSSKLTLNYGIRWDLPSPYTERYNRASAWEPQAVSPLAQATGLPLVGKLAVVVSPDRSQRGDQDKHWKLFAPRVGFAYRITSKTVVRGGYGIFYLPNDLYFSIAPFAHSINMITTPWVTTTDGSVTPSATLSNPFPTGILQPPGHSPTFQSILEGQSISSPVATDAYPYVQQWNFSVERQLKEGFMIEVAYAGSKGTHLIASSQPVDQLPDQYLSLGSKLQQQVPNPFYGLISTGTLATPTVAQGQLLRPYPQYNSVSIIGPANGNTVYHALQMKLEKRFRAGGTVVAAYTWSKIISDVDTVTSWLDSTGVYQDSNNRRGDRSLLGTDVPQHLVVSYVLDLPAGKGKRFLGNVSGLADKLVSGWGVNGVSTFQSGFPLGLSTNTNLTNSFGGNSRPNVVAGCDTSVSGSAQSRLNKWFNTGCFTSPAAFTFGDESRLDPTLRTAGINNWDFALFKTTAITERVGVQFRAEIFNLFNRVQFGAPNLLVGNTAFGVVSSQANTPRLIQFALRLMY